MARMSATLRRRLEDQFEATMEWGRMREQQGMRDCALANYRAAMDIAERLVQNAPKSVSWRCSGDGPATHTDCTFTTKSREAAFKHFERTAHYVDDMSYYWHWAERRNVALQLVSELAAAAAAA